MGTPASETGKHYFLLASNLILAIEFDTETVIGKKIFLISGYNIITN
jgi:hypothetical protein